MLVISKLVRAMVHSAAFSGGNLAGAGSSPPPTQSPFSYSPDLAPKWFSPGEDERKNEGRKPPTGATAVGAVVVGGQLQDSSQPGSRTGDASGIILARHQWKRDPQGGPGGRCRGTCRGPEGTWGWTVDRFFSYTGRRLKGELQSTTRGAYNEFNRNQT
jgi:hypothetical protein